MTDISLKRYKELACYSHLCGHEIAYWQSVDNPTSVTQDTILFINGFPSASWDWHYQWKYFAAGYPLLCADMLGFGLSAKPKSHAYSLLEQADI